MTFLRLALLTVVLFCSCILALAQESWQAARIVEVLKSVDSKPLYWVANTPVTKDETNYTVTIHQGNRFLVGAYTLDKFHAAPPEEWVRGRAVKTRVEGNKLFLKLPGGDDLVLQIVKRKRATEMQPVTEAEMQAAYAPPSTARPEALTGFIEPSKADGSDDKASTEPVEEEKGAAASSAAQTKSEAKGIVDISTVPYLAEIFVDGASVGYSPARFTLPAGKHTIRVEKNGYRAWTKDIEVADSSESRVYAELKRK